MEKRKFQVILLLFLLFLLSSQMVHAELIPKSINGALKTIFGAASADVSPVYIQRFILWVLMFAILYYGAGLLFKEHKHITIAVAITIALICALFIPESVLTAAFNVFGNFTGLILFAIPTVTILFVASKLKKDAFGFGIRALMFALATYFMGILLSNLPSDVLMQDVFVSGFSLTDIVELGIFIFTILAIWNLIKAFTHGVSATAANTDALDNIASTIGNPKGALQRLFPKTAEVAEDKSREKFELDTVKQRLEGITKSGISDSDQNIRDLELIKSTKNEYATSPKAREVIVKALKNIATREHRGTAIRTSLNSLIRGLLQMDRTDLNKKLVELNEIKRDQPELKNSREYQEIRSLANKILDGEKKELFNDQILLNLERQIENYNMYFNRALQEAMIALKYGRIQEVDAPLDAAIQEEQKMKQLLEKMLNYERILERVKRRELRATKKESGELARTK